MKPSAESINKMLNRASLFYLRKTRVADVTDFNLRLRSKRRFLAIVLDSCCVSVFVILNLSALTSLFVLCAIVISTRPGSEPLPSADWNIWLLCGLGWIWIAYVLVCFRRGPPPLNLNQVNSD